MKINVLSRTLCFLAFAYFVPGISTSLAMDLIVVVDNIKSDQGNIRLALFNNAKDFPKVFNHKDIIAARIGSVSFTIKDLSPGAYAVSAIHDLNGNESLDKNFVGMPVEPYGFSLNARGIFGPPDFVDAAIQLNEPVKSITFSVK